MTGSRILAIALALTLSACNKDSINHATPVQDETEALSESSSVLQLVQGSRAHRSYVKEIVAQVQRSKLVFNWNKAADSLLCTALEANNMKMVVGASFQPDNPQSNESALEQLQGSLKRSLSERLIVHGSDPRLSALYIALENCEDIGEIRSNELVSFAEPKFIDSYSGEQVVESYLPSDTASDSQYDNPAFFDESLGITYQDYVGQFSDIDATIIARHNISGIYDQYQHFGEAGIGVGVIDNGVLPRDIPYLSHSEGGFTAYGFYRPFGFLNPTADGVSPRFYDFFGISSLIRNIRNHGTRQLKHVFTIAPKVRLVSLRGTSLPVMLLPNQYQGVIDSILLMADDPAVRILSLSAGSIIYNHELARAIDYFNAKDKLVVAAAGTTFKGLKDLVGVVFPANLDSVIAATGLADTGETGGELVLGKESHGGPEVDFAVDHSSSSSESVSTTAGMFALVWSANPDLTRSQLINLFIESSSFFQKQGGRSPVFGWGKVDVLMAYEKALQLR